MDTTTNTQQTIYSLAAEMASWFESRTRDNGDKFLTLKDGYPEWMKQVCFEAHDSPTVGTIMPDDYRYKMIKEVIDMLSECADEIDQKESVFDKFYDRFYAPDYTYDLLQWLASYNARADFCDAYADEMGERSDLIGQIRDGYTYELREVFELVVSALNNVMEGK